MQGVGAPGPEALEVSGKGLQVGTPQGTGDEEAVEGGGHRGGVKVFGGHSGWMLVVVRGKEGTQGGGGLG